MSNGPRVDTASAGWDLVWSDVPQGTGYKLQVPVTSGVKQTPESDDPNVRTRHTYVPTYCYVGAEYSVFKVHSM